MDVSSLPRDVLLNHILPYIGKPVICVSKSWDEFMYPYYVFCNASKLTYELFNDFCRKGYTSLVNIITKLELIDINYNGLPIRLACNAGHTDIVKILLDTGKIRPDCYNNSLLLSAASSGYTSLVQLLLTHPTVNPSVSNNQAIRYAQQRGHKEIVEILMSDSRVNPLDTNSTDMWINNLYLQLKLLA